MCYCKEHRLRPGHLLHLPPSSPLRVFLAKGADFPAHMQEFKKDDMQEFKKDDTQERGLSA